MPERAASPPPVSAPVLDEAAAVGWKRIEAGVLVQLGLADKKATKRWQQAVRSGSFEPDACAADILSAEKTRRETARVVDRTGTLLRDLVMGPLLRGAKGATRRAREKSKNLIAMLITQLFALGIYSMLVFFTLLLLRYKGVELDGFFDRILSPLRGDN